MKAIEIFRRRIVYSENAFAELILWKVPKPLFGSNHNYKYKYRLAYIVHRTCVLRYDNEVGKGDHRHFGSIEYDYFFTTPEKLIADFQKDIARWNNENCNS